MRFITQSPMWARCSQITDITVTLITMQWVLSRSKWVFQAEMPWMWEVPTSHLSFLVYNRHIVVITSFWVIGEGRVEWIAGVEIEDKAILFLLERFHILLSCLETEHASERCPFFYFCYLLVAEFLSSLGLHLLHRLPQIWSYLHNFHFSDCKVSIFSWFFLERAFSENAKWPLRLYTALRFKEAGTTIRFHFEIFNYLEWINQIAVWLGVWYV